MEDIKSPDLNPTPPTPERSQTPRVPAPPNPGPSTMNDDDGTHIATAYHGAEHAPLSSRDRSRKNRSARRSTKHAARCSKFPAIRASRPSCRPASEACSTFWPSPGRTPRPRPCSTPASKARFLLCPARSTRATAGRVHSRRGPASGQPAADHEHRANALVLGRRA